MENKLNSKIGRTYERVYSTKEDKKPKVVPKSDRPPVDKIHSQVIGMFKQYGA